MTDAATLESLLARVATRWPELRVDAAGLAAALAARAVAPGARVAVDVALMCALAAGDRAALAAFERELVPDVRGALARIDREAGLIDDALQQVRAKLLVAAPAARIAEYRARGSLAAWIQVIAIRELLILRRQRRGDRERGDDALLVAVDTDPVLALTRRQYRAALGDAFRAALADLSPRDRTLLRLCFVESTGTEALAALYSVHRVTMFRWLSDARASLLDGIRRGLAESAGIAVGEIDSLIRAVASSFDIQW